MLKRLYFNKLRKFNFLILKNIKVRRNFLRDFFNISQPYIIFAFPQVFNSFNFLELHSFFGFSGINFYTTKSPYNFFLNSNKKYILIYGQNFCKFLFMFKLFEENFIYNLNKKKKMPFFSINLNKSKISLSFFFNFLKYVNCNSSHNVIFSLQFFYYLNIKLINRLFFLKNYFNNFFLNIFVNFTSVIFKK